MPIFSKEMKTEKAQLILLLIVVLQSIAILTANAQISKLPSGISARQKRIQNH